MPLIENPLPTLLTTLEGAHPPPRPYLIFYADIDPTTGKMWCSDCRDVEEIVKEKFNADGSPTGVIIHVGDKPTWKSPENPFRKKYGLTAIPTIIRLADGQEVERLVEGEILSETKLNTFLNA